MLTRGRHRSRWTRFDRRGQALPLAAVSMVAVIAVGALAVDLGMAFAARAAAQRAADSAALAGASAFLDYTRSEPIAVEVAESRALDYALSNDVLARPIEPSQVSVWVMPDSQKVRVRITATDLPTWFARVLGVVSVDVAAVAAAMASDGGAANQCVLPFALVDLWHDVNDDTNFNRIPDDGETWVFEPDLDKYAKFEECDGPCPQVDGTPFDGTGLGSSWRDGYPPGTWEGNNIRRDLGRRLWIKQGPRGKQSDGSGGDAGGFDVMIGPGNFLIWDMPDPALGCEPRSGASWVQANIAGCNPCEVHLGKEYNTQTGNMTSIKDPLLELVAQDPDAYWDKEKGKVVSPDYPGESSPRIRVIPIWDPNQRLEGKTTTQFNNFTKVFIEGGGTQAPDFPIYVRFLGTMTGLPSHETGSLVKHLRLVE